MHEHRQLEVLVGTWEIITEWHGQTLRGAAASFGWIEDGAFMRMHSDVEPDSELARAWGDQAPFPITAIIGADDPSGTYSYQYADARPVHRVYAMTFDEHEWRMSGVAGPEFHQRSVAILSEDRNRIDVRYEQSPDGENWELDFEATYVRK
jgi:hypothetical protein